MILILRSALERGDIDAHPDYTGTLLTELLGATGVLQTRPALALLVRLIPPLGVGYPPPIDALFLYSSLPILAQRACGTEPHSR